MDAAIARWVLEFLLHQPRVDIETINSLTGVLTLQGTNSRLRLASLLKKLESLVSNGDLSEEILEILQVIKEIEHKDGIEVLDSMKKAYCDVSVQCTVRFLDNEKAYFNAVKRIWKGRVLEIEKCEMGVGLLSDGWREWRGLIEARVWDSQVSEDILVRSRGMNAFEAVTSYVSEARERIGPSFLEILAEKVKSDGTVSDVLGWRHVIASSIPHAANDLVAGGVCDQNRECAPIVSNAERDIVTRGVCDSSSRRIVIVGKDRVTDGVCDSPSVPSAGKDVLSYGFHDQIKEGASKVCNAGNDVVTEKVGEEIHEEQLSHSGNVSRHRIPAASISSRGVKIVDIEELACASPAKYQCVPSPEPRVMSPLKKNEVTKTAAKRPRTKRKWSVLEEDTLRFAVKVYGAGHWKLILTEFRESFKDRTECDLKDKWRNLTK